MNEKTLQALEVLAAKLGTTSEYVWGILLTQAKVYAITQSVLLLTFGVLLLWLFFAVKKNTKEWGMFDSDTAWAVVLVLSISFVVWSIFAMESILIAILNPEYWALSQILKLR